MNATEKIPEQETEPKLREKSRKAMRSLSKLADEATEKSSAFVDGKTTQLGNTLSTVATKGEAMRKQLESGYQETVSPALQNANSNLEGASTYLQGNTPPEMVEDLIETGRRHPRTAAGLLFGLGFLIARKFYQSK